MRYLGVTERVFDYLLNTRVTLRTDALIKHCIKQKVGTRQAVYKALRELQAAEKIIWVRGYVSINLVWLKQSIERLASVLPDRSLSSHTLPVHGKKLILRAQSLEELDRLNGQIFMNLLPLLKKNTPLFFFDLHNYTYINRVPLVDWYIKHMLRYSPDIFLLVGSRSPLDLTLQKRMSGLEVHCTEKSHFSEVVAVFGDYIVFNRFTPKLKKELDTLFKNKDLDRAKKSMDLLYKKKGNIRITILHDSRSAKKIIRVFQKYFLFKQTQTKKS